MENKIESTIVYSGIEVAIIRKPYYLLYVPIMVSQLKFLNSNPDSGFAMVAVVKTT